MKNCGLAFQQRSPKAFYKKRGNDVLVQKGCWIEE
jgi:hypothetical protein